MQDALKQVRDTLGDDAIIVSTREEASGWVRVTAAVEQMPDKTPLAAKAAVPEYDEDTVIEILTDTLLKHRVPGTVIEKIISTAIIVNDTQPQKTLAKALEKTFSFAAPASDGTKPLILTGAPGAGKTLMTAKLATQAVMAGRKPAIITTDIARAGGIEQLTAYLNILQLPLYQAEDHTSLEDVLRQLKGQSVIIDTGGLNPFDPQEMKFLAKLMSVAPMDAALVLAAGIDAEEAAEMAMTFEILGIRKLIPTRLDFARRIGGILSAADKAGLGLCEASHTPQIAEGITQLTPQKLAELIMPHVPTAAQVKAKRGNKA